MKKKSELVERIMSVSIAEVMMLLLLILMTVEEGSITVVTSSPLGVGVKSGTSNTTSLVTTSRLRVGVGVRGRIGSLVITS